MQKKLALAAISTCFALMYMPVASATTTVCPFNDHFLLKAPVDLHVIRATVDGNVNYEQLSPNYFRLSCQDNHSKAAGDVFIEVGVNNEVKCAITLHDGPYEMNPTVTMYTCAGPKDKLYYVGLEHSFGTYDYTIKFTT
jgi:hypothetical protein